MWDLDFFFSNIREVEPKRLAPNARKKASRRGKKRRETFTGGMQGRGGLPHPISQLLCIPNWLGQHPETPGWWVCECEAEISDVEKGSCPQLYMGNGVAVARSQGNLPFPGHFCTKSRSPRLRILSWLPPIPWNVTKQLPWEHEKSEVWGWLF